MKKCTLTFLSAILGVFMLSSNVQAASDTTDGANEVFYEWVESYDNIHSDTYNYDLNGSGTRIEYIDFHESDAPESTSDVVTNFVYTLTQTYPWSNNPLRKNPWYVNDYYTNDNAMERDWDYAERAGYNIETADIAVFGGHGIDGKSMQFNRLYSDSHLTHRDADFGYNDLDWVFLFTCNWLKDRTRVENNYILGGAHSIMGYGTTMYMDPSMGTYLAKLLLGSYDGYPKQVEYAWHEMNRLYPGPNTSSSNPTISVVYGAASDRYDYIWDMGSVGPYPGNNPFSFWSSRTYTSLP
jgi:hypothetical protein